MLSGTGSTGGSLTGWLRFRASPEPAGVAERTARLNDVLVRKVRACGVALIDLYLASHGEVPKRTGLLSRDSYWAYEVDYARRVALMWPGVQVRIGVRCALPCS